MNNLKHIKLFENYTTLNKTTTGKFYLVIDDYSKLFNNELFLTQGKLKGLEGISSSSEIKDSLGNGEIFIEMKEFDTLEINNLLQVNYKDSDFLCANNFKNLKRLLGKGKNLYNNKDFIEFLFANQNLDFFNFMYQEEKNPNFYIFIRQNIISMLSNNIPNINSIDNLCNWVLSYEDYHLDFNYNDLYSIFSGYMQYLVKDYKNEEEWFVKNDYFEIPIGSTINVYLEAIEDSVGDKIHDVKKDILQKCQKLSKYKILFFN